MIGLRDCKIAQQISQPRKEVDISSTKKRLASQSFTLKYAKSGSIRGVSELDMD